MKPLGFIPTGQDSISTRRLESTSALENADKAKEVAAEFESLFMEMVLKSMRSTAQGAEKSPALETYQGLLDSEYSKVMGSHQGIGIQEMILEWMKQNADSKELKGSVAPQGQESKG